MNNEQFIKYIDEVYGKTQALDVEYWADNTIKFIYEITLNINEPTLSLVQIIDVYKTVWAHLTNIYKTTREMYYIEYCKSGNPHLHGYIEVEYPINIMMVDDRYMIEDVAINTIKKLPRKYYKQYLNKRKFYPHYRLLKMPCLCINLKNFLSDGWINYIQKNAPK